MIISKTLLVPAMRHLLRSVPRKPTMPILAAVRITPGPSTIRLTTTNLEQETTITLSSPKPVGIAARLAAMRGEAICIPAEVLSRCANNADKDTDIHIAQTAITFTLNGQRTAVPVEGYPAEEFPDSPTGQEMLITGASFDCQQIKRLLRAVSTDETRYMLNGIHWPGNGLLVATDGRRLHMEQTGFACQFVEDLEGITIPTAACKFIPEQAAISVILSEATENQPATAKYITFTSKGILTIRILTKVIEGRFPNYKAVIPAASSRTMRFDNADALAALRKLATFAKESTTLITSGPSEIAFRVQSTKEGSLCGSFTLHATITGTPEPARYSTKFLIDALENGGNCLDAADSLSPALITGPLGNTHVLMPMRTEAPKPAAEPQPEEEIDEEQHYAAHEP